jgi:hypothetical protein
MKLRDKPIYLSSEVFRALWLLARAELRPIDGQGFEAPIATPDEIADQMLRQAIREQHPTLLAHQAEIEKMEKKLIESLIAERRR